MTREDDDVVTREDGDVVMREDGDAVMREDGGPKRASFGPRYALILFSLLYLLKFINIGMTHHHDNTTTTHRPHPRSKRESVGYYTYTDPPSLQTRDGGSLPPHTTSHHLTRPTLATNVSQWAIFMCFIIIAAFPKPPRTCKR